MAGATTASTTSMTATTTDVGEQPLVAQTSSASSAVPDTDQLAGTFTVRRQGFHAGTFTVLGKPPMLELSPSVGIR